MKKITLLILAFQLTCTVIFSQVNVSNLLCENLSDPIGIDVQQPRFSWRLLSAKRNTLQTAYEIRVGSTASVTKEKDIIWNSNKVSSAQSLYVSYQGDKLISGQKYYWQVRVWDNYGKTSAWSKPAFFQTGLLDTSDWKGKWIESNLLSDSVNGPALLFRKQFNTNKKILSATAFITSHGMYEARINGSRIGNSYLTPGWTSYNKRLQYQTYDVTDLLKEGGNAIGVTVGSGWYRTALGWGDNQNLYGRKSGLLFQLQIIYSDGTKETIVSDDTWKSAEGPVRSSEIYEGEVYDANYEKPGWATSGYDDKGWNGVSTKDYYKNNLLSTYNETIKKHEIFKPIKIFKSAKGEQLIDFGQNLVGWEQLKLSGKKGDRITISHAEVLDKKGNFYTDNLRAAKAQNTYILSGNGEEFFEPHFTFQGFRYIKVEGYKGELKPENFTAVTLYSDMKPTGNFSCSDTLLNQLQHNIQWGQRGNFLDVPTDCPQRDERLGWTGDAQAFSRTASFNMHVRNFFCKWLKDLAADQFPNGAVPHVIPNVLGPEGGGSAGWSDASVIIPWNMYLAYGDKKILEDQYQSMQAWVKFMEDNSDNYLWNKGFHFGDWLFYRPDDDNDGRGAITDKYLIAQCFFSNAVQLVINAANVLDKKNDIQLYTELLHKVKQAFLNEYLTSNGRLVSGTQTAYVLALQFNMLPDSLQKQAAERLVENVKSYDYHLTTGFLGTPYLCHVLTKFGYDTIAYKLLLQKSYPSWLYPVTMGATTIWERWDGEKPDSTFQTPGMNSFNHYAYGAIGDWMYRIISGIDTYSDEPGYKKIIIKPHAGGDLTFANAELETYYGNIKSSWKKINNQLQMDIEIPVNTTAQVYIPSMNEDAIKESGKKLSAIKEIKISGKESDYTVIDVGSGNYHFTIN